MLVKNWNDRTQIERRRKRSTWRRARQGGQFKAPPDTVGQVRASGV